MAKTIVRKNASDTPGKVTVPPDIEFGSIRNGGDNDVFFNFDGDGQHYWTIPPGGLVPPFRVSEGEELHYRCLQGMTSILEIMAWG